MDNSCNYIYKWSDKNDSTQFIISTKLSELKENYWMAIGFSHDRVMVIANKISTF